MNIYEKRCNPRKIINFYKSLKFTGFMKLTPERKTEIDALVEKNRVYFNMDAKTYGAFVTYVAESLTIEPELFGVYNGDEAAYFFIKSVDPTFLYLEINEISNEQKEIENNALINLGYYDKYLMILEKAYNKRFNEFDLDELWERESVIRGRIKRTNHLDLD